MRTMPYVIKNEEGRDYQYDIFSLLLKDRIIFLNGVIDDNISDSVIAQLLYLNSVDSEKEISLYINSPGGSVSSGLAIYDTIRFIKAPVHTIAMGLAASMASLIEETTLPLNQSPSFPYFPPPQEQGVPFQLSADLSFFRGGKPPLFQGDALPLLRT